MEKWRNENGEVDQLRQGIFLVHSRSISWLPHNSLKWEPGPLYPNSLMASAECGCRLNKKSFVTFHSNDGHNVREFAIRESLKPEETWEENGKWQPEDTWQGTTTKRWGPGCGATNYHLVVAGGVSSWDVVLSTVEVYVIESKAHLIGGDMKQARAFFNIVPIGTSQLRLLAIGGRNSTSILKSSEWWEEEDNRWGEGLSLSTGRSSFGVVLAQASQTCTKIQPPPHSCPLSNGLRCEFPAVPGQ